MRNRSAHEGQAARAQGRSEQLQPKVSERREKGLWTFLTWAFFLSQAIAADEATATAARRGDEDDAQSNSIGKAVSEAPRGALAFLEPVDTAQALPTPPALSPDITPVQFAPLSPVQFAAAHEVGPAHAPAAPHMSALGSGTIALLDEQPDLSADGNPGGADNPNANTITDIGHGILPPIVDIVDDVLGEVVNPIVDTVSDVVSGVVGAVDPLLDSLVNTVGGVLGGSTIAPVVNQVLSPTLGTAADLLGDMLRKVGPDALADIGLDTTQTLGNLLGSSQAPQNPIESVALPIMAAVNGTADGVLAPVASAADGLLNTLGLSAGGTIEFPSSSADRPHYEIMARATYTDYGLALQSGDPEGISPTSSLLVAVTDLLAATDTAADAQPGSPAPLVSTIEDTRGLLDGLGL